MSERPGACGTAWCAHHDQGDPNDPYCFHWGRTVETRHLTAYDPIGGNTYECSQISAQLLQHVDEQGRRHPAMCLLTVGKRASWTR